MKRSAVYGVGIGINGREAAMQATQHALDQLGTARPVLALVFAAQEFAIADILAGLTSLLGDTPLWGFSTLRPITDEGDQPRSVVVALLTGTENRASVQWFPNFAQDSSGVTRQFLQILRQDIFLPQDILIAADGINGSLDALCNGLADLPVNVAGCMAAGEPSLGKTYQIGKNQAGPGGMSAAVLGGNLCLGMGVAHGWKDLGVYFRATRTRDVWLETLDDISAAETYARYFGFTSRDWAFPPLTDLARLYPLGVEPIRTGNTAPFLETDTNNLLIRSALRVEVDGSLRMSGSIKEGSIVHLMTGDLNACIKAAQSAAQQALDSLKGARPLLAVALVDAAWQLLFETRPNAVASALKSVLGETPLVGAYTFGQLIRSSADELPVLHNQNLALVIFGESKAS
jgi:hypothetical protein